MKHIVFYSGGISSYFVAKRVIEKYGKNDVILLFTDTSMEDEDLYRFISDSEKKLDVKLIYLVEGRTPWEVAKDVRYLPNSRIAQCSHILKQKIAEKYIKENYQPDECILYLGIDWSEEHRKDAPLRNWAPYKVEFPLTEPPYLEKTEMLRILSQEDNIKVPRLYELGFSHNNCGGFCFRAGIGHFKNLLEKMPDRYLYHETKEQELREHLTRDDISILRRVRNGTKVNITLRELRKEIEGSNVQLSFDDLTDIGGCGCFVHDSTYEVLDFHENKYVEDQKTEYSS
jgi:hypothetical protein